MFEKIKSFLFHNSSSKQTVAKNTVWLSVSNFGGRLIKAAVIIYAARVLGTDGWGVFSYAITLSAFLTLCMDPGLSWIIVRDGTRGTEEERLRLFSTAAVIKIFLIALGFILVLFVAPLFSTLPGAKALLPLAGLIMAFDAVRDFFSSFIRSMEKMEWETAIFLVTNIAIVVFGFIFLSIKPSALSFGWGYVGGTAVGAIVATAVLRNHFKKIPAYFSRKLVYPILQSAWPFAVTSALGLLLTGSDTLIISWLGNATDVGLYSAALRIIQVLYLVPTIIQFATLPLFSRLANHDNGKFRIAFERIIGVIFAASVPLAIGGVLLGTQIMVLAFGGAFAGGSVSFKILMLTMLVDFPAMVISNAIFAYGKQKNLIISSAIAGFTNVALDLILIPRFGIAGSAVATLIAQIATNIYLWYRMKTINHFSIIPKLSRVVLAGIVMGIVVALLLASHVNVVINIAVSGLVYLVMLVILREPLLREFKSIVQPEGI